MTFLSIPAGRQIDRLATHFLSKGRPEAVISLDQAISEALIIADNASLVTKDFPATYRRLASRGYLWFKVHRYWFGMRKTAIGNVIAVIFYNSSNIPGRLG